MEEIYDSRHSGREVDNAVDAVQTTIPSQLTQIGSNLDEVEAEIGYKTKDIILSTNVCSNQIEYAGKVVRGADGTIATSSGYNTTYMFCVKPSTQYVISGITFLAYYDENKNFISRPNIIGSTLTTPSTAHYARVTSMGSANVWQLNEGDTLLDYEKPATGIYPYTDATLLKENVPADAKVVGKKITAIEEFIGNNTEATFSVEQGNIQTKDGANLSNTTRLRTVGYIDANSINVSITAGKYMVFAYNGSGYLGLVTSTWVSSARSFSYSGATRYRLTFAFSDNAEITADNFASLGVVVAAILEGTYMTVLKKDIVNNFVSGGETKALSAAKGKELGEKAIPSEDFINRNFVKSSNLFPKVIEYYGYIVRSANGAIEEVAGYNTSAMFAVKPSTQYTSENVAFISFYDDTKQFISRADSLNRTITSPSNAFYARISSNYDSSQWQINEGDTLLNYESPVTLLSKNIKTRTEQTAKNVSLPIEFGRINPLGTLTNSAETEAAVWFRYLRSKYYMRISDVYDFSISIPSGYDVIYYWYDSAKNFLSSTKTSTPLDGAVFMKVMLFKTPSTTSSNLANTDIEYPGQIIRSANGAIEEAAGYNTSAMFAITPSTQYICNGLTFLAYYDANKSYLSRANTAGNGFSFTTPSTAAYARISSNYSIMLWQLNTGSTLLDYEMAEYDFADTEISVVPTIEMTYYGSIDFEKEVFTACTVQKFLYEISHSVNRCGGLEEDVLQDSGTRDVDYGMFMLPPNYSETGEPVRLAIFCHGSIGARFYTDLFGNYSDFVKYVAKEGFAILDIFGIGYINRNRANDNLGTPTAMICYNRAYQFMIEHFNIKTDGIVAWGKSAGGAPIGGLIYQKTIPVLAAAGLAPVTDIYNQLFRNRPARDKAYFAEDLGFVGEIEWSDMPLTSEQAATEKQYLLANADKGIGYNPVWNGCINLDAATLLTESFQYGAVTTGVEHPTERALYEGMTKIIPKPYKIWMAADDANVDPRFCDYWQKMAQNSGSYFEIRWLPNGTGKHYATDTSETALKSTVIPRYSDETLTIPIAYIEMVSWFRRFGG